MNDTYKPVKCVFQERESEVGEFRYRGSHGFRVVCSTPLSRGVAFKKAKRVQLDTHPGGPSFCPLPSVDECMRRMPRWTYIL